MELLKKEDLAKEYNRIVTGTHSDDIAYACKCIEELYEFSMVKVPLLLRKDPDAWNYLPDAYVYDAPASINYYYLVSDRVATKGVAELEKFIKMEIDDEYNKYFAEEKEAEKYLTYIPDDIELNEHIRTK